MADVIVDKVIDEKGTGVVILWLSEPEPWDTPGLMRGLQDKVNNYID
jgi:hypothetical protein